VAEGDARFRRQHNNSLKSVGPKDNTKPIKAALIVSSSAKAPSDAEHCKPTLSIRSVARRDEQ
jgi:hypothetical protein